MNSIVQAEAHELTPEQHQDRVNLCAEIEQDIKNNIAQGREAMWDLSKNLYEFNEESGWTALGYETQQEWLAQPEIGMTRTQFFRMVRKWRELVINRQIPQATLLELEPSKIDIVMPVLEDGKAKIDDVLEDVRSLGARDLRELYIKPSVKPRQPKPKEEDDAPFVVDSTAIEIDPDAEPVQASAVVDEDREKLLHAIASVESWMELGGDRRKAQRQWAKLKELLPFFQALATVESVIEGGPDSPDRASSIRDWTIVQRTLGLTAEQ